MTDVENLPLARAQLPRYVMKYWAAEEVALSAEQAGSRFFDDAVTLPLTRISGVPVFPVISRGEAARWLSDREDDVEPERLRLAFISVSPLPRATVDLDLLRPFGPTLALLPSFVVPTFFELAELNMLGIGAAHGGSARKPELIPIEHDRVSEGVSCHWRAARERQIVTLFHRH
jgi:hypothetical protein